MFELIAVAAAAFASTADLCAEPFEGGVGEPRFCRLTAPLRVQTPYFSALVDSELLVGLASGGRRLQVQPSLWQSPIVLTVEAIPESEQSDKLDELARTCPDLDFRDDAPAFCDRSTVEDIVWNVYVYRGGSIVVVAELSGSALTERDLPRFLAIVKSIKIHGT